VAGGRWPVVGGQFLTQRRRDASGAEIKIISAPLLFYFDDRYNPGYTMGMKTAISLPDPLFSAAEQFANKKGWSRSQLYAHALEFYLQSQQADVITASLNEVYASEPSALDPALAAAQIQSLPKEDW
jgi:hypothetical protein